MLVGSYSYMETLGVPFMFVGKVQHILRGTIELTKRIARLASYTMPGWIEVLYV